MKELVTDIIKLIVDETVSNSGLLIQKIDNGLCKVIISVPHVSDPSFSNLGINILQNELPYNDFPNELLKSNKNIAFRKELLNNYEFILLAETDKSEIINHKHLTLLKTSVTQYSNYFENITYEGYLSRTISFLDAIIFSSSPDGKNYYFITDAIERIMGISRNDIINHPIKIIKMINPEDYTKVKEFIITIRKGIAATVEYSMMNVAGNELYFKHSAFPVFEEGKLARIDGIIYDITREKQNQVLLQKSEERLRTLFETADDLIFVLDFKGNFVTVNSNGALSLEYLPDELKGQHFLNFVSDDDKPAVVKSFQQILKSNRIVSFNVTFNSKYGKQIIFEINARSTFDNEKVEGMLGIGRDITERIFDQEKTKELNNKFIEANRLIAIERDRAKQKISVLEELNRLKNEFVSNISHELRTPLASIIGFSETIDSDHEMPESMKIEFNQIILNEAKRLSKLINDVLDISKIEAGKITLNKMEFDVILLLSKVIERMLKKAVDKNVVLSVEIPSEEVMLYLDKERIEQVFENLLSNAIKFTNEGGRVAVFAQSFYKEFEVIISDTGIGIPKKDLPFIFQKFYRVSRPGSEIPGTGLGLALVKQIIDLHKGLITVQSEEDKGTTFIIKLPKIM
jgi:PAS domain S-box-containing protein